MSTGKRIVWTILIIGLAGLIATASASDKSEDQNDWRAKQVRWWSDDQLVKDVLVSSVALKGKIPNSESDPAVNDFMWDVGKLILLYDSMSSNKSLETLASLNPYYLGEATGEIYHCVLRRKGKRIEPALTRLLNSNRNECTQKYGTNSPYCLRDDLYREKLKSTIEAIKKNTPCVIEQ